MMEGKIIKIISNAFTVKADKEYVCRARGKFRNLKITPLVGDNVIFDPKENIILEINKRKNELVRPPIANIDQAIIVVSVKEPDLDLYLLDKLICIIEYNSIKPIICFTKIDLLKDNSEYLKIKEYYQKIGYQVFENKDENIKNIFKDKITVIAGQSGAGKSTLLNILDSKLELKTNEISKALGRGKHTTRHVELINLYGGMCADTPGFSSLSLKSINKNDIKYNFVEFELYNNCAYRDCNHDLEIDCEIKKQVGNNILKSRYDNYIKFRKEDL
ncbi:MAG: ribosome small subunit-dependent GTPase A [Firmicutes bacterium]|nr:ribosome small subunit-dependent GTPase A [Bacillota bacterium]